MKSTQGKGFTLIELMIVVAIIGLWTALIIPLLLNYQRNQTSSAEAAVVSKARAVAKVAEVEALTVEGVKEE